MQSLDEWQANKLDEAIRSSDGADETGTVNNTYRFVLLLALNIASPPAIAAEQLPNVVFFLVDDLAWRDLGCYGSSFYETPNVDQFARDSIRFTQAYAACHACSPTRASIMTGKYPTSHLTIKPNNRRSAWFDLRLERYKMRNIGRGSLNPRSRHPWSPESSRSATLWVVVLKNCTFEDQLSR